MQTKAAILLCVTLLSLFDYSLVSGRDYNKQKISTNIDFLAHEAGGNSAWPKRDYVAPTNNDYNSQFPSLGSTSRTTERTATNIQPLTTSTTLSGKQTNITPSLPAQRQQNTKIRDYVAPQWSTTKGAQGSTSSNFVTPQLPTQKSQSSGKRDYVSPQFTTPKPASANPARVKDLVSFFDSKSQDQSNNPKAPSYSSITQNNKNLAGSTPSASPLATGKPPSFSTILTGSHKPGTSVQTTQKPSTRPNSFTPTSRPASTVLPSSLVNNNKNNNQGNSPTDTELQTLSEELLRKDSNNAAKYITVNYQQKTSSQDKQDKAPLPLITATPEVWNIPTIQKLVPLLDNYERDTLVNEYVTPQERNEENAFMDVIMNTAVIRHLMNYLKEKGYVSPDPRQQRDFLKQLWFNLYSRGKGKISSSGFEHIFVSELKNGDVQGLHDWVYFAKEEAANRINYLGYLKYEKFNDKGAVMKLHFNQQGLDKPVSTMFVGTSPELEIALYTLCFVTRADNDCKLKLAAKDVNIVTHTFRYRSKNYIGSAYPQI